MNIDKKMSIVLYKQILKFLDSYVKIVYVLEARGRRVDELKASIFVFF